MGEIIEKTFNLIDTFEKSTLIKDIKKYKKNLLKNEYILSLVAKYNKEKDINKKMDIKKELFSNDDYKEYMKLYNELSMIILRINSKYKEYTNTKKEAK
ncbi:MAG: hypothetical protein IJO57_04880 [Bacilli bacterium]|nr:hypothetical protein [Bacilli bacterium]